MVAPLRTERGTPRTHVVVGDTAPDGSWRLLLGAGGVSAWVFVALLLAATVITLTIPAAPTEGGARTLAYIASHRIAYAVVQQLWLVPGAFAAVTYLALYPALEHVHRSLAALGSAVGVLSWALTLAIPTTTTGAPALVALSDEYSAAPDAARRAAIATAAEALLAQNRTTVVVGPLTAVALLLVSLVMLRGVFPRAVAWLGIAAGVLGVVAELLRTVVEGLYGGYGVLLLAWMAAVGWCLLRLGREGTTTPTTTPSSSEES
ncbi:hypothetical protein GCM10027517_13020 [Phycicoccus ginsengisoli]